MVRLVPLEERSVSLIGKWHWHQCGHGDPTRGFVAVDQECYEGDQVVVMRRSLR